MLSYSDSALSHGHTSYNGNVMIMLYVMLHALRHGNSNTLDMAMIVRFIILPAMLSAMVILLMRCVLG